MDELRHGSFLLVLFTPIDDGLYVAEGCAQAVFDRSKLLEYAVGVLGDLAEPVIIADTDVQRVFVADSPR